MNAEFNWWLLIVGLVVGAGLVWFVLIDARRREVDIDERERSLEAAWLASVLDDEGLALAPATIERVLALHRAYLEAPPPDEPALDGPPSSEVAADDRVRVQGGPADLGQ